LEGGKEKSHWPRGNTKTKITNVFSRKGKRDLEAYHRGMFPPIQEEAEDDERKKWLAKGFSERMVLET